MRSRILISTLLAALFGCLPVPVYRPPSPEETQRQYQAAVADAQAQTDAMVMANLNRAKEQAAAAPGAPREAQAYAMQLSSALQAGSLERQRAAVDPWLADVNARLDQALASAPAEKPRLLAVRGIVLLAAHLDAEGEKALRQSMDARPNLAALLPLAAKLDKDNRRDEVASFCKRTRAAVSEDGDRYEVLDAAVRHTHAASVEGGLAWAAPADVTFYKQETARREAEAAARNAESRKKSEENFNKMRAEFDANRARDDERRRCGARCEADFGTCRSKCGAGASAFCVTYCDDAQNACRRSCK